MSRYRQNMRTSLEVAQAALSSEGGVATDQAFSAHYAKVPDAASATGILGATAQIAGVKTVTNGMTQPDVPRNVTVKGKINAAVAQVETATVVGTIPAATAQVETATVAGAVGPAGQGNATVIVTADGLAGSPLSTSVAVANDDNAATVAGKIRTALGNVAAITALFTVGGATDKVILTKKVAAADDATLNISIDNGTCSGLTAAPTSADTTAGVASGAGDCVVTITAAGLEGSPLDIGVTLADADDASGVAGKIRTALGLNAAVAALFDVSGATDKVILTKKVAGVNDATLNIAIDNSTCTGLTAAPTSENTTAGLAKSVGNVVVTGKNVAGTTITETIALNGTTEVVGDKAFASITSVALPAKLNDGDTVSIGIGSKLGLAHKLKHNTVIAAFLGDVKEGTPPTVTVSATAVESNTAVLNSALDGSAVDLYYLV